MLDVSVIIVNYNTCDYTLNCIHSIYAHTVDITFEIIVVDNASLDASVYNIRKRYPQVVLIENKINLGFGRANNIGVQYAIGKYVFFLNSDTYILNNALGDFFFTAENSDRESIYGTYLVDEHNNCVHSYGCFPTIKSILFDALRAYTRIRKPDNVIINKGLTKVEYITGADLFMKRDVFVSIGGFDENIFLYFEETDLQKRLTNKGLLCYIIYGPQIVHIQGGSQEVKKFSFSAQCSMKSQHYYLKKYNHYGLYVLYRMLFFLLKFPMIFLFRYSLTDKICIINSLLARVKSIKQ